MITGSRALAKALHEGRTVCRRLRFSEDANRFAWAMADTNEGVSPIAIKRLEKRGELTVLQSDLCGEPMRYGGVLS